MVYAVIDTNVLVSARISKNPLAATVQGVASMFQNKIIPVYNDEILSEYDEVLHRPKFKVSEEQIIFLKRSGWQMAKPSTNHEAPYFNLLYYVLSLFDH